MPSVLAVVSVLILVAVSVPRNQLLVRTAHGKDVDTCTAARHGRVAERLQAPANPGFRRLSWNKFVVILSSRSSTTSRPKFTFMFECECECEQGVLGDTGTAMRRIRHYQ